eukprot:jgi/Mesvir1/19380/Mv10419-RA.1
MGNALDCRRILEMESRSCLVDCHHVIRIRPTFSVSNNQRVYVTRGRPPVAQRHSFVLRAIAEKRSPKKYTKPSWDERYQELVRHKEKYKTCDVDARSGGLGLWVARQRSVWKQGLMSETRYHKLCAIDFVFDAQRQAWNTKFRELAEFHTAMGHTDVPLRWEDNPELGRWVVRQRYLMKAGLLEPARKQRLSGIDFTWNIWESQWELRFQQLIKYKEEYGSTLVPKGWKGNTALATWVETVRTAKRNGDLSTLSFTQKLKTIGFVFEPLQESWDQRFAELCQHRQREGHLRGPFPPGLEQWVHTQRQLHRTKKLSLQRWRRLNLVAFVWDQKEDLWARRFKSLEHMVRARGFLATFIHLEVHGGMHGLPPPIQSLAGPQALVARMRADWLSRWGRSHGMAVLLPGPPISRPEGGGTAAEPPNAYVQVGREGEAGGAAMDGLPPRAANREASGTNDDDPKSLVTWYRKQRKLALQDALQPNHRQLLATAGFVWDNQGDSASDDDKWWHR